MNLIKALSDKKAINAVAETDGFKDLFRNPEKHDIPVVSFDDFDAFFGVDEDEEDNN